ncbi:MAG: hypothetical protein JWR84_611 [Caulobacter sp.]|nr:hypothetical protein [Caulobacter sp.]
MSDDKSKVGADRKRISLEEDYERRHWAERFGISEARLRQIVARVGPMVEDVARLLHG